LGKPVTAASSGDSSGNAVRHGIEIPEGYVCCPLPIVCLRVD
jgi:hypothetical protein